MSVVQAIIAAVTGRAQRPCPDCHGDWTRAGAYIPHDKSCPRRITAW